LTDIYCTIRNSLHQVHITATSYVCPLSSSVAGMGNRGNASIPLPKSYTKKFSGKTFDV